MEIDLNVQINSEVPSYETDNRDEGSIKKDGSETESKGNSSNRELQSDDLTSSDSGTSSDDDTNSDNKRTLSDCEGECPTVERLAARLEPGSLISNLDQAYVLYCEYARKLGFSVKKGTQAYFPRSEEIRMKVYHCSCEGRTDNKAAASKLASYRKQHMRSECKARLRLSREFDRPWTVTTFNKTHNHELLGPDDSYLLRSSRNLTHAKRSILETFNAAGIGVSQTCKFLSQQAGGRQNMGFLPKDAYDHINKEKKLSKIGNNDADAVMEYLHDKSVSEPYFFWRVLLDDEGRLMNFFYRDCRSADDYAAFGDVVSLDTTFKTNKYNLICAPFVGMNHHRQNVLFGIGFLSDETTKSFEWLCQTFKESMQGKEPEVIFSDQDTAIKNGIDFAFPSSSHRLCQWHINKNAKSHFGKLNEDKEFKKMWMECMKECDSEDEFEQVWEVMVAKYSLGNHKWFTNMYELRRRWSDAFTKNRFTGGLHATSRSELTNKVIKMHCSGSTTLHQFVKNFDRILTEWRSNEREEDAQCRGMPGQYVPGNPLLRQAAKVYTRTVYKLFELEASSNINVSVVQTKADTVGGDLEFHLNEIDSKKKRIVIYNQLADTVSCTCMMLATHKMFCRHILKVFYTLNVCTLPQKYIAKRWTREAKHRELRSYSAQPMNIASGLELEFVNCVIRETYELSQEYKEKAEDRELIKSTIAELREKLSRRSNTKKPVKRVRPKKEYKGQNTSGFRNPPEPEHKWFPPKRVVTAYENKKSKTKAEIKDAMVNEASTSMGNFLNREDPSLHTNHREASSSVYESTNWFESDTIPVEMDEFGTQISYASSWYNPAKSPTLG